jgi:hypothetical protein
MRNSLKILPAKRGHVITPSLEEQLRIIGGLLKLKHFDGVWCNGGTLTVRRFRDHFEVPEYLSWDAASKMVAAGEALLERKPAQSETVRLAPSIVVAK